MATLGIDNTKMALVDKLGNILTGANGIYKYTDQAASDTSGIFTADEDTAMGIASLALSNLAGSTSDIFGSNKLVYKSAGKGAPQAVLTLNALPNEIKMAVLGMPSDGKGGFTLTGKADPNVRVAILAQSAESFDETKPVYVGLYMGVASEPSATWSTNNANDTRTTDALTIASMERGDDGFGKYYFGSASKFDEDAMINDIFKGANSSNPQG